MATADHDDALQYLLSKLQSDDGWSCANLAWNKDRLTVIVDQFSNFDGAVKSKLLLSFLAMSPRVIDSCRDEMFKLLRLARRDSDEWVRLFASILSLFPSHQIISLDDDSNATDILTLISESLVDSSLTVTPEELPYLNKVVLTEQIKFQSSSTHHFNLKHQPRASSQLRADVLHRAEIDFAQTGSLIRDRIIQRQSSTSSSMSFGSTQQRTVSSTGNKSSLMQRRHREKGTKLLEIDEVPLAGSRRKRRISDMDGGKKVATPTKSVALTPLTPSPSLNTPSETTPTPDYATALGTDESVSLNIPSLYNSGYYQKSEQSHPLNVTNTTETAGPRPHSQTHLQQPSRDILDERQRLLQDLQQSSTTPPPVVAKQPNKGLKLSRQQLSVAQEIFREAPHLNKQQKALILAFMAGSRDNPLPGHNVISLKLNQRHEQEQVQTPEGDKVIRNIQLETVFEMNYNTGQWRKLQVKRPLQS